VWVSEATAVPRCPLVGAAAVRPPADARVSGVSATLSGLSLGPGNAPIARGGTLVSYRSLQKFSRALCPDTLGRPMAPGGRPLRVLVVDDYPDSGESTVALLGLHGHEVRVALTAAGAVAAAASFVPDVVLIDIGLPDGDGYGLAAKLRTFLGPATRFVAVTGYPNLEGRSRAAGFECHLVKPAEPSAFLALLDGFAGL
jgi:CheY-like chemotaxis protein